MEVSEVEKYIFSEIEKKEYLNSAYNNTIINLIKIVIQGLNDLDNLNSHLNKAKIIDDRLNQIKVSLGEPQVSYITETVKYFKQYNNL